MSVLGNGLRIAGDEGNSDGEAHRARYRWAASLLKAGSRVLDYACGTGYGTRILQGAGLSAYGYDTDERAIAYGHRRWTDRLGTELHLEDWDAAVCFEALEHFPAPPRDSLAWLLAVAPVVIASVPYNEPHGKNQHHAWSRLTPATFDGFKAEWYGQTDAKIGPFDGTATNLLLVVNR